MENYASEFLTSVYETVTNPKKRVFIGYLLLAGLIGLVWLRWRTGNSFRSLLPKLFSRKIWLSESARADYKLLIINKALFLLLAPLLFSQMALATFIFQQIYELAGTRPAAGSLLPDWAVIGCFTLFFFLLDDFARYFVHMLMHRIPALWAFHKVHHSARTMTPFTVLRTHPVEGILFALRSVAVQGISIGLFFYLFGDQVDLLTVWGVNVLVFAFNVAGSNLRHSHIAIHYWPWLEHWLISPAQHQIHHSTRPRHFDRNFGAALAIWDRIGGSLLLSEPNTKLRFGVSGQVEAGEQTLKGLYLKPFSESFTSLSRPFRKRKEKTAPSGTV